MPTIVMKWDFEDGTTQGWSLGSGVSLDSTGALQGTYSLKLTVSNPNGEYLVASISNVDFSSVSKPLLVLLVRYLYSGPSSYASGYNDHRVVIKIKSADGSTTYASKTVYVNRSLTAYNAQNFDYTRVIVIDISEVAGISGTRIEIYIGATLVNASSNVGSITGYIDAITILDGGDYEYNTGIVASDNEDKTVTISVPSADGDLSTVTASRVGISLMTPDWNYKNVAVTATHTQGSLSIDSSVTTNYHINYATPSTAPTAFQSISIRVFGWSIGAYAGWIEKVAVAFLDASWNIVRLYVFNIYFTANGVSPRFINAVSTVSYGTLVSGSRTFNVRIYGNNFDVALRVRYIYGDRTVVVSGSVKLEVFSSDLTTKYGEVSIDITLANDQTTAYITGLPTNTDLVVRMSWTIQANARIVLLAYPLFRVY